MSLAARPSDPQNSNMSKAEFLAKVDRVRLSTEKEEELSH